jgi:hypothetical protein
LRLLVTVANAVVKQQVLVCQFSLHLDNDDAAAAAAAPRQATLLAVHLHINTANAAEESLAVLM